MLFRSVRHRNELLIVAAAGKRFVACNLVVPKDKIVGRNGNGFLRAVIRPHKPVMERVADGERAGVFVGDNVEVGKSAFPFAKRRVIVNQKIKRLSDDGGTAGVPLCDKLIEGFGVGQHC